jgi:hypothetical protein
VLNSLAGKGKSVQDCYWILIETEVLDLSY